MNEFRHPSRILKQVGSISALRDINHVYVASLCGDGQTSDENINQKASAKRFPLRTRGWSKSLLVQVLKYIEFSFRVFLFYRSKDIGLVNVHHLALLPLGYLMKLSFGAKLIYDAHELETETHSLKGIKKKLAKIVERIFIRKADYIFVVSENIADWYKRNYVIKSPTVVMNAPRFTSVKKNNYFREHFRLRPDQKIVLYQGALAPARGIEEIIAAFSDRRDDAVVVIFMGYGPLEELIVRETKKSDRVFFHPAVNLNVILDYTAGADVGVHIIPNTCLNHDFCMPNKLFEYLMVGLPVLVSNVTEMREFVKKNEVGFVANDIGVGSINSAIDEILLADLSKVRQKALRASKKYSWEVQEHKMIAGYQMLLNKIG